MEAKPLRNRTLDVIKLIAAFFVVFIHVPFYGLTGKIVKTIAAFAVPIFFMTSGFFSYGGDIRSILRKIKKIVLILVFASCLYHLMNLAVAFAADGSSGILAYFQPFLQWKNWLLLLIFHEAFSATRLWFLLSLICVYFLQILVIRRNLSIKAVLILALCGLGIHLLFAVAAPLLGLQLPEYAYRNSLVLGYPFFALGLVFRHYRHRITKVSNTFLLPCGIVGCILSLIPLLLPTTAYISVGTLFIVFALFCFAFKYDSVVYPPWVLTLCRTSLGIYIFHKPVALVLGKALGMLRLSPAIHNMLLPLLVCAGSAMVTLLLQCLQRKPKR